MTIALNIEVSRIACSMAKALNAISQAIHAMGEKLGQVREAILENRAAIENLYLTYHRCKEFKRAFEILLLAYVISLTQIKSYKI